MKLLAWIRSIGLPLLRIAAILFGILLAVYAFGPKVYDVHGVSVRASISPALDGRTILEIPPVGSLIADTHSTPLQVNLTITGVRPDELGSALSGEDRSEMLNRIQASTERPLRHFVLWQIGIGALGAGLLYWALFRPGWRRAFIAGIIGLALSGALLGATLQTYNREAFSEPEYHGVIEAAPRVLHLADELFAKLQDFQDKTELVVRNMQLLYGQVDRLDLFEESGDRKILVVSDIHNNFIALELISSLAHHFEVDMVLDAGDLTDFGSRIEMQLLLQIAELGIPYVFVPGNHDSPEVIEFMHNLPNVVVLEGQIIEIDGVRILGAPDPWAYSDAVTADTPEEEEQRLLAQADALRVSVSRAPTAPHIIVTHNPIPGRELMGAVPTLVSGHTHQPNMACEGGSVLVNPGSAGAAGFRGLQSDTEVPYTAVILHYAGPQNLLIAADLITYHALSGSFTVERRLLADSTAEAREDEEPLNTYGTGP